MANKKAIGFTQDIADALLADIKMSLAGVAQKYKVDLNLPDILKGAGPSMDVNMQVVLISSIKSGHTAAPQEDLLGDTESVRIEGFKAALHAGHAKHFAHLSLKQNYRNGEHTYAIVGFNSRAREHKLLMQNVDTGEYFRMPIEVVGEYKRVRAKKA